MGYGIWGHKESDRTEATENALLLYQKIKSDTVSTVCPSISHSDGTGCHDLHFLNVEL